MTSRYLPKFDWNISVSRAEGVRDQRSLNCARSVSSDWRSSASMRSVSSKISLLRTSKSGSSFTRFRTLSMPPRLRTPAAFSSTDAGSTPACVTSIAAGRFRLANTPFSVCVASRSFMISTFTNSERRVSQAASA